METIEEMFDKETVENISNLVESKMHLLNSVKDFKEKDKKLSNCMEEIDGLLSEDLKDKFDDVIRLMYKVEEYYFTLAYTLGAKYGNDINKI